MSSNVCKCGGTGFYVENSGKTVSCVCTIRNAFEKYLSYFKGRGVVSEHIKLKVDSILIPYKQAEIHNYKKAQERILKTENVSDAEKLRMLEELKIERLPRRICILCPEAKTPIDWKKQYEMFYFQYLVRSGDFYDYKLLTINDIISIYYMYEGELLESKFDNCGFYGYPHKTILLTVADMAPNKDFVKILTLFLNTYKDRNIVLFVDDLFSLPLTYKRYQDNKVHTVETGPSLFQVIQNMPDFVDVATVTSKPKHVIDAWNEEEALKNELVEKMRNKGGQNVG